MAKQTAITRTIDTSALHWNTCSFDTFFPENERISKYKRKMTMPLTKYDHFSFSYLTCLLGKGHIIYHDCPLHNLPSLCCFFRFLYYFLFKFLCVSDCLVGIPYHQRRNVTPINTCRNIFFLIKCHISKKHSIQNAIFSLSV